MTSCASNNEEATTATICCVHDRSDDYYSNEKNAWEGDNRDSARRWKKTAWEGDNRDSASKWSRASWNYRVKCDEEQTQSEKERTQRAANVKLEEAKKDTLHYKMLSNLLIEKKRYEMFCGYPSEEATTATIGCVNGRWTQDRNYRVKCDYENQHWEKVIAQRAANVKLEEAKKSELRYKMLSNLLNEKDEA
jgi:hypothetical protein